MRINKWGGIKEENYIPEDVYKRQVYNIEAYLEKCVRSIREQTYRNLQIILVDDGSTDGLSLIHILDALGGAVHGILGLPGLRRAKLEKRLPVKVRSIAENRNPELKTQICQMCIRDRETASAFSSCTGTSGDTSAA